MEGRAREEAQLGQVAQDPETTQQEPTASRSRGGHNQNPVPRTPTGTNQTAMATGTGTQQDSMRRSMGREASTEPRELRKVRWGEEIADEHAFTEAGMWEKQAWEVDSSTHRNNSKTPRVGKWMDPYLNSDLDRIGSTYPEAGNSHPTEAQDTIWETQPLPKSKGSIYKNIMASIGLDSPNSSTESRREGATK